LFVAGRLGRAISKPQCVEAVRRILANGAQVVPPPGASLAVDVFHPKIAALCFDRAWAPDTADVPQSIRFFGLSFWEYYVVNECLASLASMTLDQVAEHPGCCGHFNIEDYYDFVFGFGRIPFPSASLQGIVRPEAYDTYCDIPSGFWGTHVRFLASRIERTGDATRQVVPFYDAWSYGAAYKAGDREALRSILLHVPMVDETALSWEQVMHFREDPESRLHYHDFVHWLDEQVCGVTTSRVADILTGKFTKYQRALQKHGIRTVLGIVSATLGGISVPSLVQQISQDAVWVSAGAGILIAGSIVAQVVKEHIDGRPEPQDEIAWIYSLSEATDTGKGANNGLNGTARNLIAR